MKCRKFDYETQRQCANEAEPRYDRYGIYAGQQCDRHWEQSGIANWTFDPADAGECLEPEDY